MPGSQQSGAGKVGVSRVLRIETGTTRRARILRGLSQALRAAAQTKDSSAMERKDILAFLAMGLTSLQESVEETGSAWERRAYWVKADRFRLQWAWIPRILAPLEESLHHGDLIRGSACALEIAAILAELKVKAGRTKGRPWEGAWNAWLERVGSRPTAPPSISRHGSL